MTTIYISAGQTYQFHDAETLPYLEFVSEDKLALEASYRFAWRIANERKYHTIGERLIKSCATCIVKLVCETEQKQKIEKISL